MNQEQIWNKIAPIWSQYKQTPFEDIESFLKDKKGRILDLGCGSGRNFPAIKGQVYGIDFSEKMLELAEKKAQTHSIPCVLFKSKASSLPFENNFFDSAIFVATLHCIESKHEREKSLHELYRVIKPKSEAFITVWSKNNEKVKRYSVNTKDAFIPWKHEGKEIMRYYYIYDKEELENLLKKVGFKIIKIEEDNNIIAIVQKS